MKDRPSSGARADDGCDVFVARQPILDASKHVIGYELLFRAGAADGAFSGDPDQATASIITDVMSAFDLDVLTSGRKAFINVTRSTLLTGFPEVLPPGRVVLELLETIDSDPAVVEACRSLKHAGFALALDDFEPTSPNAKLLPYVDYVKAGAPPSDAGWMRAVRGRSGPPPATIVERIETEAEFARARDAGFSHFQGFFFERPVLQKAKSIPEGHVDYLRLMDALRDPNMTTQQLETLIKPHASLCYRVLRTVNSAGLGLRGEVESISEAVLLLGRELIKRWVTIWAMATIARHAHGELMSMSIVRGRFCETLAGTAKSEVSPAGAFLLGMCSMLDAIVCQPLEHIVEQLPLGAPLRRALLGDDNDWRRLLDCVIAYERADWANLTPLTQRAGLSTRQLGWAYSDAMRWAGDACRSMAAA